VRLRVAGDEQRAAAQPAPARGGGMTKTYVSHSPGLRLALKPARTVVLDQPGGARDVHNVGGVVVEFGPPEGPNDLDALRRARRGSVPAHSGERDRSAGRGEYRASDPAIIAALDAHPSNPQYFWLDDDAA
jgi:hypothetical protein